MIYDLMWSDQFLPVLISVAVSPKYLTDYFIFFVSVHLIGDTLAILRSELKSQRKLVKSLKKKSLWSKSMEEVTLWISLSC